MRRLARGASAPTNSKLSWMTPYAGANRIRFYGTLAACTLCGPAPRSPRKLIHPRQRHREDASAPFFALHRHRAAKQLGHPLHDAEPEARALTVCALRRIHLPERLENLREMFGRDADAGVGHLDRVAMMIDGPRRHTHMTRRRVLHRVADQVDHDLAQLVGIGAREQRL